MYAVEIDYYGKPTKIVGSFDKMDEAVNFVENCIKKIKEKNHSATYVNFVNGTYQANFTERNNLDFPTKFSVIKLVNPIEVCF